MDGQQPEMADRLDEAVLLGVLADVKSGDFAVRMPREWTGVAGKVADTLNDVIAANQTLETELARVSRVVGNPDRLPPRRDRDGLGVRQRRRGLHLHPGPRRGAARQGLGLRPPLPAVPEAGALAGVDHGAQHRDAQPPRGSGRVPRRRHRPAPRRVGDLSVGIAERLGIDDLEVGLIRLTAPLHDVGKIALPDAILFKAGKLTAAEFEQMKSHTTIGAQMLSGSAFALLRTAEQIVLTHHEKWDGSGYPHGLAGEQIPMGRAHRRGGGRVRRAHARATVQAGVDRCRRHGRGHQPRRTAFRPPGRGGLRRRIPRRNRSLAWAG